MVLGQLDIHMLKNNEPDRDLTFFAKFNSKWIIGLTIKCKTRKLENGENLYDLGYGSDFLVTTPKAQSMKETIN